MATVAKPESPAIPVPVEEAHVPVSKTPRSSPLAPITLAQRFYILIATVGPLVGVGVGIALLWQYGFMGWLYLTMLVGGWILTGMGITIGFHRLITHRAFEARGWVRAFWMMLGTLAVQGSPLIWPAVHRRHHELSDHEGDPHSPHLHGKGFWNSMKGLFYAHVGWLYGHHVWSPELERYAPDLLEDKLVMWFERTYGLWILASLAIPTAIGGLATLSWEGAALGFLWGGAVRIFVTHHVTWAINSICHVFGRYDYDAGDESRNNPICAVLAFGEGWHNNHHAFPTSARHGLAWWQFDSSWIVIRTMEMLGLAWNLKVPSERAMESKRVVKAQ